MHTVTSIYLLVHKRSFRTKLMFGHSVLMALRMVLLQVRSGGQFWQPSIPTIHICFFASKQDLRGHLRWFFRRKELGWPIRKFFRVISLRGVGKRHVLLTMSDFLLKNFSFNDSLMWHSYWWQTRWQFNWPTACISVK